MVQWSPKAVAAFRLRGPPRSSKCFRRRSWQLGNQSENRHTSNPPLVFLHPFLATMYSSCLISVAYKQILLLNVASSCLPNAACNTPLLPQQFMVLWHLNRSCSGAAVASGLLCSCLPRIKSNIYKHLLSLDSNEVRKDQLRPTSWKRDDQNHGHDSSPQLTQPIQ